MAVKYPGLSERTFTPSSTGLPTSKLPGVAVGPNTVHGQLAGTGVLVGVGVLVGGAGVGVFVGGPGVGVFVGGPGVGVFVGVAVGVGVGTWLVVLNTRSTQ